MEYSYKFRIYPNREQEAQIKRTFGCCRFVFNYYLAKRKDVYEQVGETLNYYACCADVTQLKKSFEWLKETDATALQSSLKDLDVAYQNFCMNTLPINAVICSTVALSGQEQKTCPCGSGRALHAALSIAVTQMPRRIS